MKALASIPLSDIYEYEINLASQSAAAKVARLVGKNKSVLEVGCGPGSQSRVFRESLNCRVVGIEIDPKRAEVARQYCDCVHVADIELSPLSELLGEERFDVITCSDVLEHLRNPADALRNLAVFLKAGGFVVASLPNVTHAAIVYEMAHGRFEYRNYGLLDETHLRFFCRRSALALFESAGFAVAEVHCVNTHPRYTEIGFNQNGAADLSLMAMLISRNPDSLTYQFVLKAVPISDPNFAVSSALILSEDVRNLERQVAEQGREIRRLEGALRWLEARAPIRIYRNILRLVSREGRARADTGS